MAYELSGKMLEYCSCGAYCGCRASGEPDGSDCDAINVWQVDQGKVGGVDVGGLSMIVLGRVHGHVLADKRSLLIVDRAASDPQVAALRRLWSGELGGPAADFARLVGRVDAVEQAAIHIGPTRVGWSVEVGDSISVRVVDPKFDPAGPAAADRCTDLPGTAAHPVHARLFRVQRRRRGFDIDVENAEVSTGRFHFRG